MRKKQGKYFYKRNVTNNEEYLQVWKRDPTGDFYSGTIGSAGKAHKLLRFLSLLRNYGFDDLVKLERLLEQTKKNKDY